MSIDAKAIITRGDGSFCLEQIVAGGPGSEEVLIHLRASGICHTDFDSMSWGKPLIMGHEGAGIVLEVGEGVDHVAPGDPVLLNWAISCGRCFQCRAGNFALCEVNSPVAGKGGHAHPDATTLHGSPI